MLGANESVVPLLFGNRLEQVNDRAPVSLNGEQRQDELCERRLRDPIAECGQRLFATAPGFDVAQRAQEFVAQRPSWRAIDRLDQCRTNRQAGLHRHCDPIDQKRQLAADALQPLPSALVQPEARPTETRDADKGD